MKVSQGILYFIYKFPELRPLHRSSPPGTDSYTYKAIAVSDLDVSLVLIFRGQWYRAGRVRM
jgi:hypothetical protein